MKLDRASQRNVSPGCVFEGKGGEGIGREVGFRHRRAAPVEPTVEDLGPVGIGGPAVTGSDDVSVGVQRDDRPLAEGSAHHQVDGADHAAGLDRVAVHRIPLDVEAEVLEEGGGALGMRGAIARGIVRGHPHQPAKELDLVGEARLDTPRQDPVHVRADVRLPVRRFSDMCSWSRIGLGGGAPALAGPW